MRNYLAFQRLQVLEYYLQVLPLIILFAICVSILAVGKYHILDSLIKIIVIVLVVSTVSAFLFALYNGPIEPVEGFVPKELWNTSGIFFLLALMGWMSTAVDLSSWNSLWTLERMKQTINQNSWKLFLNSD